MNMTKQSEESKFADVKAWHRYSLQFLSTSRFARAVNEILWGDDYVISLISEEELEEEELEQR